MRWYYAEGKRKVGPMTEIEIDQLALEGKITPDTLVWNEKTLRWKPYRALKDDDIDNQTSKETGPDTRTAIPENGVPVEQLDTQVEPVCDECGRSFPVDEMVSYGESMICATCKPLFFQKLKEGSLLPAMRYAGFWIRVAAKIIDGIVLWLVNMIFSLVAGFAITMLFFGSTEKDALHPGVFIVYGFLYIVQIAFHAAYDTYFVGKYAATPGKMVCGIRIVTADGDKLTYLRAFARHFAEFLSGIILGIGYIMVAFDREKRALHDHICNTRVIKK
jgi:uncharacterized RDD family membrane protein YckC